MCAVILEPHKPFVNNPVQDTLSHGSFENFRLGNMTEKPPWQEDLMSKNVNIVKHIPSQCIWKTIASKQVEP